MVMITFDDSVTDLNFNLYTKLFDGRKNPNDCPISTTYFISHLNTNYERVRDLFAKGELHLQLLSTIDHFGDHAAIMDSIV